MTKRTQQELSSFLVDLRQLTGCMVPPAMMTALHCFNTWAKWTAGFNSRNLTLLSDKLPGR